MCRTYYQQPESIDPADSSKTFGLIRRSTLGRLLSPLQPPSVLDRWAPREVALFESALCLVGKQFPIVASVVRRGLLYATLRGVLCFDVFPVCDQVKTKNVQECVEFYYVWKKSKNYAKWKETFSEEGK